MPILIAWKKLYWKHQETRVTTNRKIALVVAADEPALFFSSIRTAELWLEAIDVEDRVYRAAYGPEGERYSITADENRVVISPDAAVSNDPDALKALLLKFLKAARVTARPQASLASLLRLCEPFVDGR